MGQIPGIQVFAPKCATCVEGAMGGLLGLGTTEAEGVIFLGHDLQAGECEE